MGELGDYWRDIKAHKKEMAAERAANAEKAIARVEAEGYILQEFNNGNHLKVYDTEMNFYADWWPTTGTFRMKNGKRGGGAISLLANIKKMKDKQSAQPSNV